MDDLSSSDTIPFNEIHNSNVSLEHEAKVSKVSEEQLYYMMSRGISEEEATFMQKQLSALVDEDVLLEYVDNVVKLIENLTDEQVKNLGPDGVEELFTLLSKFYYAYIQMTNPLWEVAQARIAELGKWQKLYMDKYYHK